MEKGKTMTDREKLIELIGESLCNHLSLSCKLAENIAADLISNGVTFATDNNVGTWIPVTERLPEVGERCLCNVKSFAFPGSFYQAILKYDKYGFVEGCIYTDDVTHWMPLPEPPMEV
jgi:hypothetical protein